MLSFDIININIIILESQIKKFNLLHNKNLYLKTLKESISFQYKINIYFFIVLQTTATNKFCILMLRRFETLKSFVVVATIHEYLQASDIL